MEEISLREIIEIFLKGKWIIAFVTVFFMLVGGIYSFFIAEPVYQAQTMLMISPISNVTSEDSENKFFDLVGSLSQYPQMTVDTYKEQIKAPVILNYIRSELGLENTSLSTIAEKITVEAIKNTNLITVSVKDTDPQMATKIANLISDRFTKFVSATSQKQAENSAQFINEQATKEKQNLDQAMALLMEFLSQPRGPEELKLEVNSKLNQLTDFKTQIVQVRIDENSTNAALDNAKNLLSYTPKTLVTQKTILNEELLSEIVKDKTDLGTNEIAGLKLSAEEINDIYLELTIKVNELEIQLATLTSQRIDIEKEISLRQKELEELQAEMAEKQQKYDTLYHHVELIKQTYDAYQQKYKEAMIKQSADIGQSSIIVVSQAIPPMNPVAPNKLMNIAIAAVLGLMVSAFTVFLRDYWKNSKAVYRGEPIRQ